MEFSDAGERRRFSRIEFDGQATLTQDECRYPAKVLDISIKGVLVRVEQPGNISSRPAVLQIELADGTCIEMHILLIHRHEQDLGFQCESIDFESAAHLRRLIELNLNTPDATERVLEEMLTGPNKH